MFILLHVPANAMRRLRQRMPHLLRNVVVTLRELIVTNKYVRIHCDYKRRKF